MTAFLTGSVLLLLLLVAGSLMGLLRAPSAADRMMAVQLAGTGSAAVAVLLAVIEGTDAILDVALILALLAAFASAALSAAATSTPAEKPQEPS